MQQDLEVININYYQSCSSDDDTIRKQLNKLHKTKEKSHSKKGATSERLISDSKNLDYFSFNEK